MKKNGTPREFEITEPLHPLGAYADSDGPGFWRKVLDAAEFLESRKMELEASAGKIGERQDDAKRKLLLSLIEEIMDNLDRVIEMRGENRNDPEEQRWIRKFQRIRRKMEELLAVEQVVPIELISAPPGVVTIAGIEERDDVPDGTIVSTNWRGYLWRGEVLRKASVVVARNTFHECPSDESIENGGTVNG